MRSSSLTARPPSFRPQSPIQSSTRPITRSVSLSVHKQTRNLDSLHHPQTTTSDDELPSLNELFKATPPKQPSKATSVPVYGAPPVTPPTTPSQTYHLIPSDSPTTPKRPDLSIKPTHRNTSRPFATPTSSHKRLQPHKDSNGASIAPSSPLKRLRLNPLTDMSNPRPATSNHSSRRMPNYGAISSLEASRISESVLRQIDWDEVAHHVATNRHARRYRRALQYVLEGWTKGLVADEDSDE